MRRRRFLQIAAATTVAGVLPAHARATEVHVHTGPAFGSAWRLVLPVTREAAAARARLEAVVAQIDALMSPYRADAEIARFNATGSARISSATRRVAEAALALARSSGGAFDPTLAPLGRRYGFGPLCVSSARPAGRYRDIRLSDGLMTSATPGLTLDLCGIAKGYALDRIVQALDGLDFFVELGGEVAARGRHPAGRRWRAAIEQPGTGRMQDVIAMDTRALATSGDAIQGYEIGERRYSHVIDARTRSPVANGVASVSVRAASGLLADGLATAAMVLGPQAARALLAAHDASALFVMRRAAGLEAVAVNGFALEDV